MGKSIDSSYFTSFSMNKIEQARLLLKCLLIVMLQLKKLFGPIHYNILSNNLFTLDHLNINH